MWINDLLKRRAEPAELEDSSLSINDVLIRALFGDGDIDAVKAMNIPAFAGCVNVICNTISTVPIKLYRRKDNTVESVDDDNRVYLINDDTKDTLTGTDFKRAMVYAYLTDKGGYAFLNHRGSRWYSINYVKPSEISFMTSDDPIFKDYEPIVSGNKYRPYDFIKFCRRTDNGYEGKSVIKENKELLKLAYAYVMFENGLLSSGGNKKGFLQSDHKLRQEEVNLLKTAFEKFYGKNNDSNVVVLNDGVKFQPASSTSTELQLNENKAALNKDICKLFMVPPAIISGGVTAEEKKAYIQNCIIPILDIFCASLNRDMLLEREKADMFFAPDLTELTQGDIKTRFEAWGVAVKNGIMQVDEVREKENLPALNMPFLKLGLQDVLYDPVNGEIYTPNTDKWGSLRSGGSKIKEKGPEGGE